MSSIWRSRRPDSGKTSSGESNDLMTDLAIPTLFRCPISLELMKDPVIANTGITYDRHNIETWLDLGNTTCPVTNQPIAGADLIPNHALRRMIQDWCVANRSLGVERIPTPRIPLTKAEASQLLSEIKAASERGDHAKSCELAGKLRGLARESERNRRCIASSGAGRSLSAAFDAFARAPYKVRAVGILEEVLSALAATSLPLDEESCTRMGSPESLSSLSWIIRYGDLSGRLNAVLCLKEIAHPTKDLASAVSCTEGLIEALVKLIKEPISPRTTKASLVTAFYLVSSSSLNNRRAAAKLVELGTVPLLLETLVDADRSTAEKVLGVLDGICESSREAVEEVRASALAVPVLVKKMIRVSEVATQFAISVLWRACRECKEGECVGEAVRAGMFQKLLLVLQVGCGDSTKEKATEMLRVLNAYRGREGCIEATGFRGVKRAF